MHSIFSASDLKIFEIPSFEERMPKIKTLIRPKLEQFGFNLQSAVSKIVGIPLYVHTAKHMRRKVNPPDETWVAWGPKQRGYKAHIFYALCIGKNGFQTRVTLKDESAERNFLGKNLLTHQKDLIKKFHAQTLIDFTKVKLGQKLQPIENIESFISDTSQRLIQLKSAYFDVGIALPKPFQHLEEDFLKQAKILKPLFLLGLKK